MENLEQDQKLRQLKNATDGVADVSATDISSERRIHEQVEHDLQIENSLGFQSYLKSKKKYQEVYRRLAAN